MSRYWFIFVLCFYFCIIIEAEENDSTATLSTLTGGNARILALGGSPSNPFLLDHTDIYTNPAHLMQFKDLLFIEVGHGFGNGSAYTANNQSIGITFSLNAWTFGLSVGVREGPMFADNSYGFQSGGSFRACDYMKSALDTYLQSLAVWQTSEPTFPMHLFCAKQIGDVIAGVTFYHSNWSRNDHGTGSVSTEKTCSSSLSQIGIKAGAIVPLSWRSKCDIAGCIRLNRAKANYSNINPTAPLISSSFDATGYEFSISARLLYEASVSTTLVPYASIELFSYEPELSYTPLIYQGVPFPNEYGKKEFEIGFGVNHRLKRGLVAAGISLRYLSLVNNATTKTGELPQTTYYTRSWTDFPTINVGVEYFITTWLIGRTGLFKRLSTQTTTTEPPTPSLPTQTSSTVEYSFLPSFGLNASEQTLSLGIGLLIKDISINAYIAEQVLGTGTYLMSGIEQSLFGVLSINYKL